MELTAFQREWIAIAERLDLNLRTPYQIPLGDRTLELPVLVQGFGGRLGMLLVTNFAVIADAADRLVELGYGYSCLTESTGDLAHPDEKGAIVEMLRDWGWAGPGSPPEWYNEEVA